MLPRARSSCSGEGSPVVALDQLSGPEEEVLSPGAGCCKALLRDHQLTLCGSLQYGSKGMLGA